MLHRSLAVALLIGSFLAVVAQPAPARAHSAASAVPVVGGADDCSNAFFDQITGLGIYAFDTTLATTGTQGQNNALCNAFGTTNIDHDVWFCWTAGFTGRAAFSTCGSATNDTKIAVYDGCGCPTTPALACNDDFCSLQSQICFSVVAGNTYTLQLGTYPGTAGAAGAFSISAVGGCACGAPTIVTGPSSQVVCGGSSATLSVSASGDAPFTYQWRRNGATIGGATSSSYSTTIAGSYDVVVTNPCGSATSSAAVVTIVAAPVGPDALASPLVICAGQTSILTAVGGAGASLRWFTGSCGGTLVGTGTTLSVSPATTTTYYCRYESPPCSPTACGQVTVTVQSPPVAPTSITASPSSSICSGQSVTLTAVGGSGAGRQWFSGSCGGTALGTGATQIVSPTTTTTYYCRWQRTPCAPSACASITIVVATAPSPPTSITATATTICSGGSTTLTANGGSGGTRRWSTSCGGASLGSGSTLTVSPTTTTTYFCRWESSPCTPSSCASITITVRAPPVAPTSIAVAASPICAGEETSLTVVGGSGDSVLWWTGGCGVTPAVSSSPAPAGSINVAPTETTTYYAQWRRLPCADSVCVVVTVVVVDVEPPTAIGASSTTLCAGETTTLTAVGGQGSLVTWSLGSCGGAGVGVGPSVDVSPTTTTTYFARWTGFPCAASSCASVTITVVDPPQPPTSVAAVPSAICAGASTTLSAIGGSGATVEWRSGSCDGPVVGSGNPLVVSPTATTVYYAAWENARCAASACAAVTVDVASAPPNDECSTATPITCVGPIPFSTTCATTSAVVLPGCDIQNDVWYRYQSTHTGRLTVSACGSADYPVALAIFAGDACFTACAPEKALLKCADGESFCGTARLEVAVADGLTYWIRVGGQGATSGSGTLFVTCDAPSLLCEAPSNPILVRTYSFVGPPANVPWSFELTTPRGNVRPLYCAFVPGVATSLETIDVARQFATFVNTTAVAEGCGTSISAKAWPSVGTVPVTMTLNMHPVDASQAARLWVGPANGTPCCLVGRFLPACGFNPLIQELDLPGFDCNGNERDDVLDIQAGFSLDANTNDIPDECEADVGTVFCAGDGIGPHLPCPCGNDSGALEGAGCLNSLGIGARLRASGGASLAVDTLVLSGNAMPNSSALYFQGTSQSGGGAGVSFGDGLRCAGGSVIRLATKLNVSGASSYPLVGDDPVSVRGSVAVPGSVRTYQIWYRNAASFCTTSTFNLSNGLEIAWLP